MREVLWKHERQQDFLSDVRGLCRSLDSYEIIIDVPRDPGQRNRGQRVHLVGDTYELGRSETRSVFSCPECGAIEFDVLEGVLDGKPVLGLACVACETYGIVCPVPRACNGKPGRNRPGRGATG